MNLTIVIHTEDKDKLSKLFKLIEKNPNKKNFSLYLHAKGYIPWEDDELKKVIVNYRRYNAFPTLKSKIESVVEIISRVKDDRILILDEDCDFFNLNEWDNSNLNFLLSSKEDIVKLNLDTKYQTLKWFIVDLISQKNKTKVGISDESEDSVRYFKKIESPIFYEKIIYVDGGMGDHIMVLPLLEKIQNDIHICCKYPFVFEHLNFKGGIHWNDDLFGGYRRFVYEYGSVNNSKTIIDAFFEMYGYERHENDLLIYNGVREKNQINTNGKPIALICSSAAKIQNLDSNKDWRDIRWLKLVHELQKQNYYVIQVGTIKDNQIPMVDLKYLDKPLPELASLIDDSSLWVSVDTFFHHFASSIKPNVGICLTPFYNDHAKHKGVTYIEKDCGKDFSDRKWWTDLQQPERKECMDLIQLEDVLPYIKVKTNKIGVLYKVNKDNIHLLEFSSKNSRSFSDLIIVKFDDFGLEEKLVELRNSGVIDLFLTQNDESTIFQDMDFKVVLSADEVVEKQQIISVTNDMSRENIDVAVCDVITYFKNLNYILTNENKVTKPLVFKVNNGSTVKPYDYLKLHNLRLTYDNKTDDKFSESFNTFYYNNVEKVAYNGVQYDVNYNDISNLKIDSLVKVVCVSNGPNDNCSNWRMFQPYDRFENGINYELDLSPKFNFERDKNVDIVMFGRPIYQCLHYLKKLRDNGVKVIVDYDDMLPIGNLYDGAYYDSYIEILKILLTECDMVTTTNDKLKYYFEQHSPAPVEVFPNIVKEGLVSKKSHKNSDKIILGWYGSGGHINSLKIINKDVLRILDEFDNVYLNLYTENQDIINLFKHNKVRFIDYNYNFYEFQNSINEIDINLSPIEETYVNFCKSDIRVKLTGYKGIPSIVSDFSEYKEFANLNGGSLVCKNDEWYEKIKSLILDNEKYNDLLERTKQTIDEHFNYQKWSDIKDNKIKNLIIKNE